MKRYQFRLERILEIRHYREQQWELKLAAASGECLRLQNEIQEMDEAKRETIATRYQRAGLDMGYLLAAELFMRRLEATTRSDLTLLSEKERIRDEVREEYLSASRDRKVLDRLKEKRALVYRRQQLLEETKLLDDLGGSAAARARIEG